MATITLNDSCNGNNIQVKANDIVEINLDESPTTGYKWQISQLDKQHFQIIKEDYQLYAGNAMGGGGTKTIQLKALAEGSGLVRLQNIQPWSGDVYKTFEFRYS